ncbi:MAG: excinuclease ABC subunit UvrC, partial [Planctomycetota bacterium]|nr:excinuclease ABC subunit UvrC [Planctomycetota bacterium]
LDGDGKALYVGKAARLRDRVRSYLKPGGDGRAAMRFLESEASDVEFLVTRTEQEALLLENTIIKKRKPKYNVKLKDDKSFLMLRLDPAEPWPWFRLVRRRKDDGSLYFGPYASAKSVRRTLRLLHKVVPLRDCSDAVFRNRSRSCLKHQIGRCPAPCVGEVGVAEYAALVERAIGILNGRAGPLLRDLKRQMTTASGALEFERAQALKVQIEALTRVAERQGVVGDGDADVDVVGLYRLGDEVSAVFLLYRGGKLEGSRRFAFRSKLPVDLLLSDLLGRFYEGDHFVPGEILVPDAVAEQELVRQWLASKRGRKVQLLVPKRGSKLAALRTAEDNARLTDAVEADQAARRELGAHELARLLALPEAPRSIHCLDVSTIQGRDTVASRIAFLDGLPDKAGYRKFKISPAAAADDFSGIEEAVRRSLSLCLTKDDEELPDLIIVDGGAGQVSAAEQAFADLGLDDEVALVGLAKSRRKGSGDRPERSHERLFRRGGGDPLALPVGAPVTLLVAALRDEAHRFAIRYHRQLRGKLSSQLDEVDGVGKERRRVILRHFGSMTGVRAATREQLMSVPGLPSGIGARVYEYLHRG